MKAGLHDIACVIIVIRYDGYMSYRKSHPYEPGDTIAIRFGPGLSHYGVVTHRGTVISNSRKHGGVVEQSLSAFANGRHVRLTDTRGGLGAVAAEARARKAIGARYSLLGGNCSQFARWTYRRKPTVLQKTSATMSALGDLAFGHKRRRF